MSDMKIAAILLAAGSSSRLGQPKQLLTYKGLPFIKIAIDAIKSYPFNQIIVVLGAYSEQIKKTIESEEKILIVENNDWKVGQSTSVIEGMRFVDKTIESVMFFVCDQPKLTPQLIVSLIDTFKNSDCEIAAPVINGVRVNPVIFSRDCFDDLLSIQGDRGGRAIFPKHQVIEMEWPTKEDGEKVDTKEEYNALINNNAHSHISSIILSAGLSTRMKTAKLLLPWADTTVMGKIIQEFQMGEITDITVVTGGYRELIEEEALKHDAKVVFNPDFSNGEMLDSLKVGLASLQGTDSKAAFIALGDQPGIHHEDIIAMKSLYFAEQPVLLIPSYNYRRGHPWLISRNLWTDILSLQSPRTMRDFIETNKALITYYNVKKSNIIDDLDTPDDYQRLRPK